MRQTRKSKVVNEVDDIKVIALNCALDYAKGATKVEMVIDAAEKIEKYLRGQK